MQTQIPRGQLLRAAGHPSTPMHLTPHLDWSLLKVTPPEAFLDYVV